MKLIVCGSRGYASANHKYWLKGEMQQWWPIELIIHGACPNSADMLADELAHEYDIPVEVHPADWTKHGKAAGFIRNKEMAEIENVSQCVAIWDGKSRGTLDMIQQCIKNDIPVNIIPAGY